MSGLEVQRLRVRRGAGLVLDVEALAAPAGAITVVHGGAGSGKTTLAAALCGAIDAGGEVKAQGAVLAGPPSRRRRLGLAAAVRDGERLSGCSVGEALRLAAPRGDRAREAAERLPQLGTRLRVAAELLSGGEQQLLQVACAWAAAAAVLVLDTPTVGLAADAAAAVAAMAREEAALGRAVLWLESDPRAAPVPAALRMVRGALAPAAGSGPAEA